MSQFFPELGVEPAPVPEPVIEVLGYNDLATAIKTLTEMAAALALGGDIPMAKAFTISATPLIEIAMQRFPEYRKELTEHLPEGEVADQPEESTEQAASSEEGTES